MGLGKGLQEQIYINKKPKGKFVMVKQKECAYCGKTFIPASNRMKYCSPDCKAAASQKLRSEWVKRSGYNEKRRLDMQKRRAERYKILNAENDKRVIKSDEDLKRYLKDEEEKEIRELKERAKNGDMLANLTLVNRRPHTLREGLEASKAYHVWFCEQHNRISMGEVNGIDINDPDWINEVIKTMKISGKDTLREHWYWR